MCWPLQPKKDASSRAAHTKHCPDFRTRQNEARHTPLISTIGWALPEMTTTRTRPCLVTYSQRERLAASQFRGILREEELAQHVRRRRGNLHQHQRDLVPTVTGPMPGPGQNGNPTAGGKKRLRPFSSESILPTMPIERKNERRSSTVSRDHQCVQDGWMQQP